MSTKVATDIDASQKNNKIEWIKQNPKTVAFGILVILTILAVFVLLMIDIPNFHPVYKVFILFIIPLALLIDKLTKDWQSRKK